MCYNINIEKGSEIMRVLDNKIALYKFEELIWDIQLKLIDKQSPELKDIEYISPVYYEKIKQYYNGVEFYADGTIYEEI